MKDDVRYSELLFLRDIEKTPLKHISPNLPKERESLGLSQVMYAEMVITLLEDLYIHPEQDMIQRLVYQLRGETQRNAGTARSDLFSLLIGAQLFQFRITYRGLRRIEELRELLKRDRIFEPFGALLDVRYFVTELREALQLDAGVTVSVLRADMDNYKRINEEFGHAAGDVVMKSYLEVVRDCLGPLGAGFRNRGDETVSLIVGQGHERAVAIAETIRRSVEEMSCEYGGKRLPKVSASIGIATTPPEGRTMDIETLADQRQKDAKERGKNRVIAS